MQNMHAQETTHSDRISYLLKVLTRYKELLGTFPPNMTERGYREAELGYNPYSEKLKLFQVLSPEDREIYRKFFSPEWSIPRYASRPSP